MSDVKRIVPMFADVSGSPASASGTPGNVVREIRAADYDPSIRHQTIMGAIDALAPGEALRLRVDHEPKPLFYMLQAERAGQVSWEPEQNGPDEWRVVVRRTAAESCC